MLLDRDLLDLFEIKRANCKFGSFVLLCGSFLILCVSFDNAHCQSLTTVLEPTGILVCVTGSPSQYTAYLLDGSNIAILSFSVCVKNIYIVACQRGGVSNESLWQRQDTGPGIL